MKKEKKCWICRRNEKEICDEVEISKEEFEDFDMIIESKPEDDDEIDFYWNKNKQYICRICWTLLNGYIDSRCECLYGSKHELQLHGNYEIRPIE